MLKVFRHYLPVNTLQQVLFDAAALFLIVVAAIALQVSPAVPWVECIPSALAFAAIMITLNAAMGLYRPVYQRSGRQTFARVALSLVVSIPVAYVVFGLLPWAEIAPHSLQVSVLILLCSLLAIRGLVNQRQASGFLVPRVLIVGTGHDARIVHHDLTRPLQRSVEIVGFLPVSGGERIEVEPSNVLPPGSLVDVVRNLRVDEVIVAVRERRGGVLSLRELLDCKLAGIRILDLSSFFERVQGQVRLDSLRASWLIYGDGFRQGWARTFVKRCFDLAVGTTLLLLAAPIMLLTALLILLEDGAPIFYSQERVGRGGRIFRVIKFRSMRRDAEKDGKPRWASSNDDRVTRVGRVIRKLRIDELPQLFNVLAGEMSLVGPRPERLYFVDQLTQQIPFYAVRHCVKPGVTGWAQVRYQYGASVDDAAEKLQYDLYYVKNHSLILDTLVLFETVRVVLTGEGAH
ncbi:UDP-N-acetylgalactosamine-undecaprenyl-phosphate N-acetylgalactosaminephosphotransferase [Thauera sp. GDN1]|uniref:TIGR03013 family XrtA/PEP-CTERM system glycosyltransferase n=1 Tax=Thauera sp. GDN1 TaxID=2944810 RepID=UPI00247928E6|nr:TIGR03013 family XrtA/PEP-CTERM system glycosyltransferase [Thauera sp. GDN1]WEN43093.1 UDP-N-acetylgalactosamine-undecaprenyl-phosphate N-acetylgalactosaminephosphotransferase [Thauera sp. GDN1]